MLLFGYISVKFFVRAPDYDCNPETSGALIRSKISYKHFYNINLNRL